MVEIFNTFIWKASNLLELIYLNPIVAIIFLLGTYCILYYFLIVKIKPSKIWWNRLEYTWILIGFLGVLSIINENSRDNLAAEFDYNFFWYKKRSNEILSIINPDINCYTKYPNRRNQYLIKDTLAFCKWINSTKLNEKDLLFDDNPNYLIIPDEIKDQKFHLRHIPLRKFRQDVIDLNDCIFRYHSNIRSSVNYRTIGVIFIIFGFALRLLVTTYKIKST